MENSANEILPIIILLVGWTMFILALQTIYKTFQDWISPKDNFAWPKKYLGRKIKYQHPVYKGQEVTGTCEAILLTKDKGKGGVPKYKLHMQEGSGSTTDIWLDSKWEYVDVKAKP